MQCKQEAEIPDSVGRKFGKYLKTLLGTGYYIYTDCTNNTGDTFEREGCALDIASPRRSQGAEYVRLGRRTTCLGWCGRAAAGAATHFNLQ